MPFPTFTPPIAPSPGTGFKPEVKLFKAEFGDGYTQRAPNGINHIKETMKLTWQGVEYSDMVAIRDFLEARGGYEPFYYQPRNRSAPVAWTCESWSTTDKSPWSITADFEQSFQIDT